MTSGSVIALRIARARLVITVRRKAVPAACPLHQPLFACGSAAGPPPAASRGR